MARRPPLRRGPGTRSWDWLAARHPVECVFRSECAPGGPALLSSDPMHAATQVSTLHYSMLALEEPTLHIIVSKTPIRHIPLARPLRENPLGPAMPML